MSLRTIGVVLVVIAFLLAKVWVLVTARQGIALAALGAFILLVSSPAEAK